MIEKINLARKKLLDNYDLKNIKTIIIRYFLYSFGVVDGLMLPFFLKDNPEVYSNIEYYRNAIFLFPNVLLGAYSGYTYVKYNFGVDYFQQLFKVGLVLSLLSSIIVGFVFSLEILIIPLIIINLFTILEQKLKVLKEFTVAFFFKPLLAVFSILLGAANYFFKLDLAANIFILTIFFFAFLVWIIMIKRFIIIEGFLSISKTDVLKYFVMVKKIFTGVLATLVFGLLIFSERFIVEKYFYSDLPTYSFAFSLSQIIVVVISAFSYLSNITLGEKIKSLKKESLIKQFKVSFIAYIGLLLCFVLFLFLITPIYPQFNDIVLVAFLITIFKGFFFIVGIFSPIAVFKDFNNSMLGAVLVIFVSCICVSVFLAKNGFSVFTIYFSNGLFIFSYSLYVLNIVFRRIKYEN